MVSPLIFVSYRDCDEPWAAALLCREFKYRFAADTVFRDGESIPVGRDFRKVLTRAVARSSILVAVIGRHWRSSLRDDDDWVRKEIALAREADVNVVPVLVGQVEPLAAGELPDDIRFLAYLQYLQIRHRDIQRDLNHVVDSLLQIEPHLNPRSAAM